MRCLRVIAGRQRVVGFEGALHMGLVGKAHLVGDRCQWLALGQQVAGCIESKIEPVGPWRDAGDGREAANKPARAHTAAQCQGLHAGFIFGVAVQML